jgi:hypothetical protein
MRLRITAVLVATLLFEACPSLVAKKDTASGGLEAALRSRYRLLSARLGDAANVVLVPGTILTVRKEGILSFPEADASFSELCPSEFQPNGNLIARRHFCAPATLRDGRLLRVQENVCVRALDVNRPRDVVRMSVITCAREHRGNSAFYALVTFRFPKNAFATLTVPEVEQAIDRVLADCSGDAATTGKPNADDCSDIASTPVQTAGETAAAVSGDPSAAKPSSPSVNTISTAIATGQTPNQVIAVLGQPASVSDKGSTVIYFYPNFKIVFVDGKVSQIQQI